MERRNTRQRDVIERALAAAPGPLSVAELHAGARAALPDLGVATVYRALRRLQDEGKVRALTLDGESRFERADLGHHHHFACRVCGGVFDLPVCPVELPRGTLYPGGYLVEAHEITLYGVCPACTA